MKDNMTAQLMSKESVKALCEYLSTIPGVYVLPADDPLEAIAGFVSYHGEIFDDGQGKDGPSMRFGYRFAKPVSRNDRLPVYAKVLDDEGLREQLISMIRRWMKLPVFVKCDRPKQLLIGFVKYAGLDTNQETEALFIPIHLFKRLPTELRAEVDKWRGYQDFNKKVSTEKGRREVADTMAGMTLLENKRAKKQEDK